MSRTASLTPEEMRDLTIGPAGSALCLRMVRGAEAPPMLRGVEYSVTLRRTLPAAAAAAAAERSALQSLTGRRKELDSAGHGPVAPVQAVGVSAAAAAATELVRQVERLLGGGPSRDQGGGEGVRGGCVHFYI